jgi:hypothetical protein
MSSYDAAEVNFTVGTTGSAAFSTSADFGGNSNSFRSMSTGLFSGDKRRRRKRAHVQFDFQFGPVQPNTLQKIIKCRIQVFSIRFRDLSNFLRSFLALDFGLHPAALNFNRMRLPHIAGAT